MTIEEIIVTAEKRASTVQDTAIAITALTGDRLIESGIQSTEDLSYFVPGLVIQRDLISKVVIRGIGTENFTIGGDPGVAIHLDGAYIARSSVAIFDLFDVERVEVLKGPQGTLYGRNATGGVINIISKRPTEETEGYGRVTYGNYDQIRLEAAISGAFADGIRARIAGLYAKRDGFTKNIFPGIEARGLDQLDTKDLWAIRGQISFDVASNVTIDIQGDIYRDTSNPPAFKYTTRPLPWTDPLNDQGAIPYPNAVHPTDLRIVSQGFELDVPGFPGETLTDVGQWDQTGVQAKLTWDVNENMTFTSLSAYRDIEFAWLNDGDGVDIYYVNYFQNDASKQFTQEFQLTGQSDRLIWIAGAYYLNEKSDSSMGIPLPLGLDLPLFIDFGGSTQTDAYAVFGQGTYNLDEHWRITVGARYNHEKKSVDATSNFFGAINIAILADKFSAFTPKFGVDYVFDDGTLAYVSVTRGFKSGGYDLLFPGLNAAYNEEFVWSYEGGLKTRLAHDRVQVNLSAFYYDYSDLQVARLLNLSTRVENAAQATVYGGEIEVTAIISEGFTLDAGISYLNSEFDEFCTEDPRNSTRTLGADGCGPAEVSLAGAELPRSPDFTLNLALQYETPVGDYGNVRVRGEWIHVGSQFFTQFNRPELSEDAVSIFNARLEFTAASGRWSIAGWVRNLADKDYFTDQFESGVPPTAVVAQGVVAPPRTFGVTLGATF